MSVGTKKDFRLAIIGASGVVGRELLEILEERKFPVREIQLFASKNSAGEKIEFNEQELIVEELTSVNQIKSDIAFFAAGSHVSKQFVQELANKGCICIDKSSYFRTHENIPLVVPSVNGQLLKEKHQNIIATPNCVAAPLAQVLAPLNKLAEIKSVVVSTYQAVSGAGKSGHDELEGQVRNLFNLRAVECKTFDKRIAFNVLPFIPSRSSTNQLGQTGEEEKVIFETKKILGLKNLLMDVTCVRVPVFNGHCMSVNIETKNPIKIEQALDTLASSPAIIVNDNPDEENYPTAIDASGNDATLVGRIRVNSAAENGLSLWIACDNLRGGAALNAVRIAEHISLE